MPNTIAEIPGVTEIHRLSNHQLQDQIDAAIALHQMGVLTGNGGEKVRNRAALFARVLLRRTSRISS